MMDYDSTADTLNHIELVHTRLMDIRQELRFRAMNHDASKLSAEEKPIFDEFTPLLRELTYGSDEYKAALAQMKPALDHHYANNSHHPEHYENGINGMSLLDVIEMLADWKAATLRHADGDMWKSLEINRERFQISDQLAEILENTIKELYW